MGTQQLRDLHDELAQSVQHLEEEVSKLGADWVLKTYDFDPERVDCEDWHEGEWNANYSFEISIKSPEAEPELDFEVTAWDEWRKLNEPKYRDVFEPLQKCAWKGFKREDVLVEFSAINVVDSDRREGIHVYNNSGWL